jgi:hypothetical protein
MWQVDNRTPFAADRGWVRDRSGAEVWLVAVKATFDIGPDGSTAVAAVQPPVLRIAEHHGEPGKSSIRYESDLLLTKKTTDVLLVGHACAPEGYSVTHADVGFQLGPMQKVLRVTGDRTWGAFGASAPRPFERVPLVWERAYGGVDTNSDTPEKDRDWRNPIGTGYGLSSRDPAGRTLPNIEDPNALIGSPRDQPAPAGFGAIACHWQPRARSAGTYDDRWMKTRQPLLAEDLDDRYFQCAPADQQAPQFLHGGEPVTLHNLHPKGRIQFTLPKLHLGFETRFHDGSRELHRNRTLHTVILEPDFPRVSLVWHSALPCHFKVQKLERTIVTLKTDVNAREPERDDGDLEVT